MDNSDQNARVERRDEAVRADARARSIATFLPSMSPHELEQIDEFVMSLIRDREKWARHEGDSKFHAVADISNGSVSTLCNGRWEVTDEYQTEARPARADRCDCCQARFAAEQLAAVAAGCTCRTAEVPCPLHVTPVEEGLRELVANAPIAMFSAHRTTLVEFEMSDDGADA